MNKALLVLAAASAFSLPSHAKWNMNTSEDSYHVFSPSKPVSSVFIANLKRAKDCRVYTISVTYGHQANSPFKVKKPCQLVVDGKVIHKFQCTVVGVPSSGQVVTLSPSDSPISLFDKDGQMLIKDAKTIQFGLTSHLDMEAFTFDGRGFSDAMQTAYNNCALK